jgi:ankyrin repeat protein
LARVSSILIIIILGKFGGAQFLRNESFSSPEASGTTTVNNTNERTNETMMMRSMPRTEPTRWVKACREGAWNEVRSYLEQVSGTTGYEPGMLTAAIRSPQLVPLEIVRAIIRADPKQFRVEALSSSHRMTGSILHEAIEYHCSYDVVKCLIDSMQEAHEESSEDYRIHYLATQDYLGRTPLHCLIERWKRFTTSDSAGPRSTVTFQTVFETLVSAYPDAIGMPDGDRNTPFIMLLLWSPPHHPTNDHRLENDSNGGLECYEQEILEMIKIFLRYDRTVATTSRPPPPQPSLWLAHLQSSLTHNHSSSIWKGAIKTTTTTSPRTIVITPLYYALLHGRSEALIELLLQRHDDQSQESCIKPKHHRPSSYIVTPYHEVYLHVAVTTYAAPKVISMICQAFPEDVRHEDMYGLLPLDWLWIRHVQDLLNLSQSLTMPVHPHQRRHMIRSRISRRRHLPTQFLLFHDWACQLLAQKKTSGFPVPQTRALSIETHTTNGSPVSNSVNLTYISQLHDELWSRLVVLLPATAEVKFSQNNVANSTHEPWMLLHSACYISCPMALVQLVIFHVQKADFQHRDERLGRCPLHYAAGRVGYQARYPIGISRGSQCVKESSPVFAVLPLFPEAARVADIHQQLPLHIAIDTFKQHRMYSSEPEDPNYLEEEIRCLELLLACYPASISRRDGKTMLYPWQQAAVGRGSCLTTIYDLFRSQPTLLHCNSSSRQ